MAKERVQRLGATLRNVLHMHKARTVVEQAAKIVALEDKLAYGALRRIGVHLDASGGPKLWRDVKPEAREGDFFNLCGLSG